MSEDASRLWPAGRQLPIPALNGWLSCLSVCLVQDDTYSWTDGWPVLFTQWGLGEPSFHPGEGCVSMHSSLLHGIWNDTRCEDAKPYVCKISSGRKRCTKQSTLKRFPGTL